MNLPFELHVALRYLLARRKQAFISVISAISTLGVVVGVMALVIALALMTGLQGELRDRILGSTAHVYVYASGGIRDYRADVARLRKVPHVTGAAPAILGPALIISDAGRAFITIKGIDPALEKNVTDIGRSIRSGALAGLEPRRARPGRASCSAPTSRRSWRSASATCVQVMTPEGMLTPLMVMPRTRRAGGGGHLLAGPLRVRFGLRLRLAARGAAAHRPRPPGADRTARGRHLPRPGRGRRTSTRASAAAT